MIKNPKVGESYWILSCENQTSLMETAQEVVVTQAYSGNSRVVFVHGDPTLFLINNRYLFKSKNTVLKQALKRSEKWLKQARQSHADIVKMIDEYETYVLQLAEQLE
jgi:hypothetical protein